MKYNLVVAGGGLSGVAAAISGAREGLKVLLVEKSGCLGGALANNLVYPFMPYWTKPYWDKNVKRNYLSQGIFKEMKLRHDKYVDDCKDHEFNSEYFKIVLISHSNLFKYSIPTFSNISYKFSLLGPGVLSEINTGVILFLI